MPSVRITQRLIDDLTGATPPAERDQFYWDSGLQGFGVVHRRSGALAYLIQWREPITGRQQRMTLGRVAEKAADAARADAAELLAKARDPRKGQAVNPLSERKAAQREAREAWTFRRFVTEAYLESTPWPAKAPSTRRGDLNRINNYLMPALGGVALDQITTTMVRQLRTDLTDRGKAGEAGKPREVGAAAKLARKAGSTRNVKRAGAGGARRTLRVLSAIFALAVADEDIKLAHNPVAGLPLGKDGRRKVIPTPEQYGALWPALDDLRREGGTLAIACDAIAIIGLTGARRGEINHLRWRQLAADLGAITLQPDEHKGGWHTGDVKIIGLPADARVILARYQRGEPDAFVFAGRWATSAGGAAGAMGEGPRGGRAAAHADAAHLAARPRHAIGAARRDRAPDQGAARPRLAEIDRRLCPSGRADEGGDDAAGGRFGQAGQAAGRRRGRVALGGDARYGADGWPPAANSRSGLSSTGQRHVGRWR